MTDYRPPTDDQLFLLGSVLDFERVRALPAYQHADLDTVAAVLEEGARFTREVLAPLNATGDAEGSRLIDGRVITPRGFPEAFARYVEDGWPGLDMPQQHGGQSLPLVVQAAFAEMVSGANAAFGMLPLMLRAAAHLLMEHGDERMQSQVVPKLARGQWSATICISEPQAGSDVARIRTRALAHADGSYRITGSKCWITYADHDLSDQICHMLLARTGDAASGTRGLTLFVVPKFVLNADGSLGARNGAQVARVEHKMGLKASPTCVLDLDNATGYRVGAEGAGLKCLFTMVNLMRLEVGMQGIAVAHAAAAVANAYALQRPQGGPPDAPPVPIINHADVRRMLLTMRARVEPVRALVLESALNLDIARFGSQPEERADALLLAEWLLPVCKTFGSEAGFEVSSLAVQVLGGHGYVTEGGIEQHVRDARVQAIYEGANGIQALDLVTRKLAREDGRRYALFAARVRADIERHHATAELLPLVEALHDALARLDASTALIRERVRKSARDAEAGATAYMQLVGLVACGWMWLRMAAVATGDTPLHRRKRVTARFFTDYLLPDVVGLERKIMAGAASIDALDAATLAQAD